MQFGTLQDNLRLFAPLFFSLWITMSWLKSFIKPAAILMLAMLVAISVWYAMPNFSYWQRERLAQKLLTQVHQQSDDAVRVSLYQMAELGEPGVKALVLAASSQRHVVADVARQITEAKLAQWQILADEGEHSSTSPAVSNLASVLADQVSKFGPAGKQWVESLTLKMIKMSEHFPAQDAAMVLANSERILEHIPPQGPRMRTITPRTVATAQPRPLRATPQIPLDMLAVPSGRAMEVGEVYQQPMADRSIANLPEESRSSEAVAPESESYAWQPNWREDLPEQPPLSEMPVTPEIAAVRKKSKTALHSPVIDVPSPAETHRYAEHYRGVSSEVLFNQLSEVDFYRAGAIRSILRQRGFDDQELELVQRMSSSVVEERIQIIDDLSSLPGGRARRWLKRMVHDESGEVRLRALSVFATTDDPQLFELAKDLALNDQDERVAKLASRIMKQSR